MTVLILNFLYLIVTFIAVVIAWYVRKNPKKMAIVGVVWLLMMLTFIAITPAIPKYSPSKFAPVVFEAPSKPLEIRDNLRKPEFTPEEQRIRAEEIFDWKTRVPEHSRNADKAEADMKQVEEKTVE